VSDFIFLYVLGVQTAYFDITKGAGDGPTMFLTSRRVLRLHRKKRKKKKRHHIMQVKIALELFNVFSSYRKALGDHVFFVI